MRLISHRGNINGRIESEENNPSYIDLSISSGYEVEIDVWVINNVLWLGHDLPQYKIDINWILERTDKLWVHCKNIEALIFFHKNYKEVNYFWHQNDTLTLTSKNFIWVYPGKQPISNSIAVLPEIFNDDVSKCFGVCSDFIINYTKL
jgi:hypothetical protein